MQIEAARWLALDKGVVNQPHEQAIKHDWRQASDRGGSFTLETAAKDRQLTEVLLLLRRQKLPGSLKDHTHTAVSRGEMVQCRAEKVKAMRKFSRNFTTCHHAYPLRGKFN